MNFKIFVSIISIIGACGQNDPVCPDGWDEGKNKCYKFIKKPVKPSEANEACAKENALVFTPSSHKTVLELKILCDTSLGLRSFVYQLVD